MVTEYMYLIVNNDDNELVGKRIIFSFTIAAICWQNLASFMVITFFFKMISLIWQIKKVSTETLSWNFFFKEIVLEKKNNVLTFLLNRVLISCRWKTSSCFWKAPTPMECPTTACSRQWTSTKAGTWQWSSPPSFKLELR